MEIVSALIQQINQNFVPQHRAAIQHLRESLGNTEYVISKLQDFNVATPAGLWEPGAHVSVVSLDWVSHGTLKRKSKMLG